MSLNEASELWEAQANRFYYFTSTLERPMPPFWFDPGRGHDRAGGGFVPPGIHERGHLEPKNRGTVNVQETPSNMSKRIPKRIGVVHAP